MEIHVSQIERRSWIEINLSQIRENYLIYKRSLRHDAEIMAVVKSDAYGHGDVQIARMLSGIGVSMFAVSNIDEAVGLREAGINGEILILGYTSPRYARTLVEYGLTQAIVSDEYAKQLVESGNKVKCQVAIDTGMNRIGIDGDDAENCEKLIRQYCKVLDVNGMFTHLCVADSNSDDDKDFTVGQLEKFQAIAHRIKDLALPFIHCMNSAGGMRYSYERFADISKIIRLGIVLYGLKPGDDVVLPDGITPAITWKTVISMVKDVKAGEYIGYGRSFKVTKDSRIATIATGYADGLNRLFSNRGFVIINGKKAPIVGKVCMDQTLVDITDIHDVEAGMHAVIIGRSGDIVYTADDMAADLGTIGYEVICNITKRVQRFYANSYGYYL